MKKITILVFTLITTIILIGRVLKAEQVYFPPATDAEVEESGNLIKNGSVFMREEAACTLAYSRNPKAIKYLIEALSDEKDSVKTYAIIGIGELGGKDQIPILINVLKKEDKEYLHSNAIRSLQKIGIAESEEEIIAPYITKLIKKGWQITDTVSNIRTEKTKKTLVANLQESADNGKTLKEKINAAYGLVNSFSVNPEKYENLSIDILNSIDKESEKKLSIRLLVKSKSPKAKIAIQKALNDKNIRIKSEAEDALKRMEN